MHMAVDPNPREDPHEAAAAGTTTELPMPTATPQQPIHPGFGRHTTAAEAIAGVDLRGRTAVVTGAYSGLGHEVARVLVAAGAHVVAPARRVGEARRALADLPGVEIAALDLMDPASIDAFAAGIVSSRRPLHLLVHGAAIMASPLLRDARGHEAQFSTNHLGHFQLALRLWPALRRAGGARIVAVSSRGHQRSAVDFDDVDFERRPYERWSAYGQSKTANALFAVGADARGRADGIRAFAVHPGSILTNLTRHLSLQDLQAVGLRDENGEVPATKRDHYKTVPEGAATIAWCAAGTALHGLGGVYCEDLDVGAVFGSPSPTGVCRYAIDPALADRLWTLSESLTGARLA